MHCKRILAVYLILSIQSLSAEDTPDLVRSSGIPRVASLVSGNGRLFAIEDTSPPDNPFLPAAFRIVARDALKGKELWARKITRWESVTLISNANRFNNSGAWQWLATSS